MPEPSLEEEDEEDWEEEDDEESWETSLDEGAEEEEELPFEEPEPPAPPPPVAAALAELAEPEEVAEPEGAVAIEAQEVEIPEGRPEAGADPDGQLRLFPAPEKPAAQPIAYRLPPISLLDELPLSHQRPKVEDKSQVLLDALQSFGVQANLLALVQGPTVTRYELQPARGVKVNRFTSLTNDIALALAAKAVRIEAPIPGKAAIGIEIPNEVTEMVLLREILAAPKFRKSSGMSIALGKDLSGTPTFAALQKMPHLLVAGTTGSGKSVCVNALIMSLLYRFTPRELQLLMIDPKQVELSIYEGIPHLISLAKGASERNEGAIICDPKRAAMALHQVVELMEMRYGLFASARVRNLDEYNLTAEDPLPWVVVIIDELADLMMVASKSVETSICRIAQKARAAGIHLVLATQRPSADVITGLIKVNVPSRIAFAVSSQVDSRVILDTGGAEQLLGKGDMLFCPVDASDPRRLQGCYVTNDEILRVVEWWRAQASPDNLIQLQVSETTEEAGEEEEGSEDDALVEQALLVVIRRQQASASLLQTELKVGYARARRLIYLMEKKGYIGPAEGSKPRKILVSAP
jgi:S-DNA-T family DNA segregation ATPase FtsK/SpoIIIE